MLKTGNDSAKFLNLAEKEYDRLSSLSESWNLNKVEN
jgi:hypothetical protein